MKSKKGLLWIILGLLQIAAALSLTLYNYWDADRADRAAQHIVQAMVEYVPDEPDAAIPKGEEYPDREMPAVEIDGYRYIGTLTVPALELTLPVMEEWDYDRLKLSPCRYAGSVYQNNMVLMAHNYARHFSSLKSLPLDSEIIFTDAEGNDYYYTVAWTEILMPDQSEEMVAKAANADWDLTLFTCTTGGSSRYTLRCMREMGGGV